ncbi:helix-turn-helix transcriptional regulator [Streptomyces sp. UNOC14_S4]|uniref:helix-turn-helix domain-containing protein n=1 Tax=Streptomyces sp. UNOC14_S4 TaxID=2872340 RepID=UPI001E582AF0|nr:helix-turn-helix transcriptional regulator [Streptomyces sp. UNOC14_S4]MCC3771867.1 helix-turn-helix domain-containing protein [Streptomyces sp. UNOC14_S4]
MSVLDHTPMAWRLSGNQVKLWRTEAKISREVLAQEAGYGIETVRSMETGRRRPTERLLEVADQLCGAKGKLLAVHPYLEPDQYEWYAVDFVQHEAEAISLNSFQPLLIPGQLQTEETMRALFNADWPPVSDETIEERVKARAARQVILQDRTKEFSFIIGEAALRNTLGDAERHKRQLLRLLEEGKQRNIVIQVLPIEGAHPGVNGSFVLLETPEHRLMAYEEGQMPGSLYSAAERVSTLLQRHILIARHALTPKDSARFIKKLTEEL